MRARLLIPAALTTLVVAGCGIADPYTTKRPSARSTSPTAIAATTTTGTNPTDDPSDPRTGTYPPGQLTTGPTGVTQPTAAAAATPQAALSAYAQTDTNWTAQTLGAVQTRLAAISVGQARANALQAAASYGSDTVLQHSHVRNTGQVVAIAPDEQQPGVWVVVTSEHTTGSGDYAGLPAQLHVTYARLTHTPDGFQVSEWSART